MTLYTLETFSSSEMSEMARPRTRFIMTRDIFTRKNRKKAYSTEQKKGSRVQRSVFLLAELTHALFVRTRRNSYTAKNQYRKLETNHPRKGIARPQSQFPHSCVCERFIFSYNRSAYSAAGNMWTNLGNIYRSQTHE